MSGEEDAVRARVALLLAERVIDLENRLAVCRVLDLTVGGQVEKGAFDHEEDVGELGVGLGDGEGVDRVRRLVDVRARDGDEVVLEVMPSPDQACSRRRFPCACASGAARPAGSGCG